MHISSLDLKITIHPVRDAQIASLLAKRLTVLAEYSDFADVFSKKSANVLPEQTGVNKYAIEVEKSKQPPYGPIYNLGPIELETLKTYIKTNLANSFIRASKLPTGALILFVHKPKGRLRLCVNYQGLNNLTIKN